MDAKSRPQKEWNTILSTLNMAIDALNFAKDLSGIEPAKIAFGTVSGLLTTIRVRSILSRDDELLAYAYPGLDD